MRLSRFALLTTSVLCLGALGACDAPPDQSAALDEQGSDLPLTAPASGDGPDGLAMTDPLMGTGAQTNIAAAVLSAEASPGSEGAAVPGASETMMADSSGTTGAAASPGVSSDAQLPSEDAPHSDVPPPSRDVFIDAACEFEGWVGHPVDEAALKATGRPYRVLKPGDMITMDHNPDRINVEHEGGKVTRVWCG